MDFLLKLLLQFKYNIQELCYINDQISNHIPQKEEFYPYPKLFFLKYHLDIKQIAKTDADLKDVLFLGKTSGHIDKSFTITCAGDHTFLMFGFCFLFLKQYT